MIVASLPALFVYVVHSSKVATASLQYQAVQIDLDQRQEQNQQKKNPP
jgi:hypothetical protein